jgi:hypothetical protein
MPNRPPSTPGSGSGFVFAAGTTLSAGEVLAITRTDDGWTPGVSPVWNNGGDLALLQDPKGTVVACWRY